MFKKKEKYEHDLYREIRDLPQRKDKKKQIISYWKTYKDYAPKKFLNNLQYEQYFKHRWWEMFLGVGLINLGFEILTSESDKGPDFRVNTFNGDINIEAVAPKQGKEPNRLPNLKMGVHDLKPKREKFLLRLSNALKNKKDKFNKYIEEKVVDNKSFNIIAISTCSLSQYGSLMDISCPSILSVLKDVGNPIINLDTGKCSYAKKSSIKKSNGSKVSSDLFDQEEYAYISAVLFSNIDILNSQDRPEESFVLVVNNNAKNKLSKKIIEKFNCDIY